MVSYAEVLARNIRAARSRADIGQEALAARMRALGYDAWIRQTVSSTERGRRRPTADEMLGLAFALETSMSTLMAAKDEDEVVEFPSGAPVPVRIVQLSTVGRRVHGAVQWDDDEPVIAQAAYPPAVEDVMRRMVEGRWPPEVDS